MSAIAQGKEMLLFPNARFRDVEPNLNYGLPKLFRPAELIQTPILIAAELSSKSKKCSFGSNCLRNNYVIIIYGLGSVQEMFGV